MSSAAAWFIPPVNDDAKRMRAAVLEQGMGIIPEDGDTEWPQYHPVAFYGSIDGMKHIQVLSKQVPSWLHPKLADWCNWDAFCASTYMGKWGEFMLAQKYGFYPLGELRRLKNRLRSWYYSEAYPGVFIRPDAGDKPFDGMLVSSQNLAIWLGTACKGLPDEMMCLVAKPERIEAEYRLVVADGEVITASRYMRNEKLERSAGCPHTTMQVAERAAKVWSPHRVFVIDVAEKLGDYGDNGYYIIEANSINTSGLYACDEQAIVRAMSRIAEEEYGDAD